MKVIIWGYPLHSHTHSYIHAAWFKAFTYMKYDTYWFDDLNFPSDFDFTHCLFITEGYADKRIPIHVSNTYIVHVGVSLEKYIQCGSKVYDLRYNDTYLNDCNYSYDLSKKINAGEAVQVGPVTYFEKDIGGTPKIYMSWATDLLPHEFDETAMYIEPNHEMVFIGTISTSNCKEYDRLVQGCNKVGIAVKHIDPWRNPVSMEENRALIQKSVICPDIRGSGDPNKLQVGDNGTDHKSIGYIPCRVFKNISYGKLGATNSKRVYELFGEDLIIYDDDETQLAIKAYEQRNNYDLIRRQMEYVKHNHTYINRINDILHILTL